MPAPQSSSVNPLSSGNLIQRYSDVLIAVAIVTIVIMMIIPLPTILLDILICLNITIALLVVMSAIYNVRGTRSLRLPVITFDYDALSIGAEYLVDTTYPPQRLCR